MPRARLSAVLAACAVLGTAAAAPAATRAPAPRGVTFTDAAGDANFLDGRANAASQPAFDVVKVRVTPYERNRATSGRAVRLDLGGTPSTTLTSSYVFTATLNGCAFTASRTVSVDGGTFSTLVDCGPGHGSQHSETASTLRPNGNSVAFVIPARYLPNARIGAVLTNIAVGTAAADPALGTSVPTQIDTARYAKAYRLGS
jgi:hypothetical protein